MRATNGPRLKFRCSFLCCSKNLCPVRLKTCRRPSKRVRRRIRKTKSQSLLHLPNQREGETVAKMKDTRMQVAIQVRMGVVTRANLEKVRQKVQNKFHLKVSVSKGTDLDGDRVCLRGSLTQSSRFRRVSKQLETKSKGRHPVQNSWKRFARGKRPWKETGEGNSKRPLRKIASNTSLSFRTNASCLALLKI